MFITLNLIPVFVDIVLYLLYHEFSTPLFLAIYLGYWLLLFPIYSAIVNITVLKSITLQKSFSYIVIITWLKICILLFYLLYKKGYLYSDAESKILFCYSFVIPIVVFSLCAGVIYLRRFYKQHKTIYNINLYILLFSVLMIMGNYVVFKVYALMFKISGGTETNLIVAPGIFILNMLVLNMLFKAILPKASVLTRDVLSIVSAPLITSLLVYLIGVVL